MSSLLPTARKRPFRTANASARGAPLQPVLALRGFQRRAVGKTLRRIAADACDSALSAVELESRLIELGFVEGARVTVLHEGSVLAEGDLATVQNDERVIEVYLGR